MTKTMSQIFPTTIASLTSGVTSNLPQPSTDSGELQKLLTIVFGTVGAIAVLVIVIAGFIYITSHGDARLIAQAKNTILYAIVGLVIVIMAFTIVDFIIGGL